MHLLPTKPIESITVFFSGDSSVGIPRSTFNLECFIDPKCFVTEDLPQILNDIKSKVRFLYEEMQGDKCSVMFDYEVAYEMDEARYAEYEPTPTRKVPKKGEHFSKNYVVTLPNTPEGRAIYESMKKEYRLHGQGLRALGRGPRKAIFLKRMEDPNNWEHTYRDAVIAGTSKRWNHNYRPRLADCERFDVYFR